MTKVSVVCVTYNHRAYIRQALDGFVMQKTNFPFEVIVHDDASTDGTTDIIREYEQKYPDIIKPVYQKENQWRQGKTMSKTFIYPKIKGEYVAFCEGDDYWTDENKLQKQVDFLDANLEFSICFHPVIVKWEDNSQSESVYPPPKMLHNKTVFEFKDLTKYNFIQTNSVMYRWRFHRDSLDLIPDHILPGDWYLHLLHAQIGKIGFLPNMMAVYRKHSGGIWYGIGKDPSWYLKTYQPQINFCIAAEKQLGFKPLGTFYSILYSTYYAAILFNRTDIITNLQNQYNFLKTPIIRHSDIKKRMFMYKIIYKLLPKPLSIKYKAHYKALRLYLEWKNK